MTRNRNWSWGAILGLVALVALLAPNFASGQEYSGKFTLPFETRWGQAILPSGDYSFMLDKSRSGGTIRLFQGRTGVALVKSQAYDLKETGDNLLIVMATKKGNSVSELRLPEIGVVLYYSTKQAKYLMSAQDRGINHIIPVTITGK